MAKDKTADVTNSEKDRMEKELAEKIPAENTPGEERGERMTTAKKVVEGQTDDSSKKQ